MQLARCSSWSHSPQHHSIIHWSGLSEYLSTFKSLFLIMKLSIFLVCSVVLFGNVMGAPGLMNCDACGAVTHTGHYVDHISSGCKDCKLCFMSSWYGFDDRLLDVRHTPSSQHAQSPNSDQSRVCKVYSATTISTSVSGSMFVLRHLTVTLLNRYNHLRRHRLGDPDHSSNHLRRTVTKVNLGDPDHSTRHSHKMATTPGPARSQAATQACFLQGQNSQNILRPMWVYLVFILFPCAFMVSPDCRKPSRHLLLPFPTLPFQHSPFQNYDDTLQPKPWHAG